MLKKLIATSIVAAFAFLTPALAQAPDASAPAAEFGSVGGQAREGGS